MTYKFGTPSSPVGTVTDVAGTQSTDAGTGVAFSVTLNTTGTNTLENPTNLQEGQKYTWQLKQDAVTPVDVEFGGDFYFADGTSPTITQVAGAVDILRATAMKDTGGNIKLYSKFEADVAEVVVAPCYNGDWVVGKVGNYAIDLPGGTSAYISAANISDLGLATGTMAFWMKLASTGVHRGLAGVSKASSTGNSGETGFMMTRASSGIVYCYVGDGSSYAWRSAGTVASPADWNHYAMTWDASGGNITASNVASTFKAYINGSLISSSSGLGPGGSPGVTPGAAIATQELTIATTWRTGGSSFGIANGAVDGPCDEFAVWDTALSLSDIESLAGKTVDPVASDTISSTNLVLYYSFEEGPGNSTIIDRSTNGNDHIGTLNSMTPGTPC